MAKAHQDKRATKEQNTFDGQERDQTQQNGQQRQQTSRDGTPRYSATKRDRVGNSGMASGPGREAATGRTGREDRTQSPQSTKKTKGVEADTDLEPDGEDVGYQKHGNRDETKHNPNRPW